MDKLFENKYFIGSFFLLIWARFIIKKKYIKKVTIADHYLEESRKGVLELHEVFQKHGLTRGNAGKDICKASAEILDKIFKVIPSYNDIPCQCKCPKCDARFFLPNSKIDIKEQNAKKG